VIEPGLSTFIHRVNAALDARGSDDARTHVIRGILAERLLQSRFVSACVAAVLEQVEESGRWANAPIHRDDARAYIVRMLYWPAGYENVPHEHLTWTVSGVLHGGLNVFLWQRGSASDNRLALKRTLEVRSGEVGCLVPPCIHSFENAGNETSVSIHVIATGRGREPTLSAGPPRETHVEWLGTEERAVLAHRRLQRMLLANISIVSALAEPPKLILGRCFDSGDRTVKLAAARAIARLDPARGSELVSRLARDCEGPDRARLLQIADRLAERTPKERSHGRA
jgi:predicted metal-dependent enzyme (double-stranded beta helix superfamily)